MISGIAGSPFSNSSATWRPICAPWNSRTERAANAAPRRSTGIGDERHTSPLAEAEEFTHDDTR